MIKPGDFIQWEVRGMLMFREPKKVQRFSPCGNYVFVEKEVTGIPVEECTKVEVPFRRRFHG